MDMVFEIEKGEVKMAKPFSSFVSFLSDGEYVVSVQRKADWDKERKRSTNQNALFWKWMHAISKVFNAEYGDYSWNKDNVHDYLCSKFSTIEILPNGDIINKPLKTSKLNKAEMAELMTKIQHFMREEHGFNVPLPEDVAYMDFLKYYNV